MTRRQRILCVGRVYCDLVFRGNTLPQWGQETFTDELDIYAGGGAFITGAYLSALGADVQLAGTMGHGPPFEDLIAKDAATCGLDLTHVQRGGGHQVTAVITGARDRAFLTRKSSLPITLPVTTGAAEFDHIHVGELASLVECPKLIELAHAHGATISCDCGSEPSYGSIARDLLPQLDLFMPAQDETVALEAQGINLASLPHLVTKKGAAGASACIDGVCWDVPARMADVIDTTGAGDAFNAGYLAAWLQGAPAIECLHEGAKCGAAAVQTLGGWQGSLGVASAKAAV